MIPQRGAAGRAKPLGMIPKHRTLEFMILDTLWAQGPVSVRDLQASLPAKHQAPCQTVRTVLYRLLARKQVRIVKRIGDMAIFEAAMSRDEAYAGLIDEFSELFMGQMDVVLDRLLESGRLTPGELQHAVARMAGRAA